MNDIPDLDQARAGSPFSWATGSNEDVGPNQTYPRNSQGGNYKA